MEKDFEIVWNNCLSVIKDNVTEEMYKTWFMPLVPKRLEENKEGIFLYIQVPSHFYYEYLETHFYDILNGR